MATKVTILTMVMMLTIVTTDDGDNGDDVDGDCWSRPIPCQWLKQLVRVSLQIDARQRQRGRVAVSEEIIHIIEKAN